MTDLIDYADSGEIPRIDDLGEGPTTDLRQHLRRDTTEEFTQNLAHEIAGLPPRRRPEAEPTALMPLIDTPLGLSYVDLEGPQKPPPPLPKPKDPAETDVNIFGGLGADLPEPGNLHILKVSPEPEPEPEPDEDGDDVVFRRGCSGDPVPVAAVVDRAPASLRSRWRRGRHAQPATFAQGLLVGAGLVLAIWSGLTLAALAVIR